jgi:hypothetical protein
VRSEVLHVSKFEVKDGTVRASLPEGLVLRPGDRARWRFKFEGEGPLPSEAEITVYRAGPLRRLWTIVYAIAAGRGESLRAETRVEEVPGG